MTSAVATEPLALPGQVLALATVAEKCGIHPRHVKREMDLGFLRGFEIGGKIFATAEDIEYWWRIVQARKPNFGQIYVVGFLKYVKIGFSENPEARIATLQISAPLPLQLHMTFPGTYLEEKEIHAELAEYRLQGEWFLFSTQVRQWMARKRKELGRPLRLGAP